MIRVERIGKGWDVQVRRDFPDLRAEFALVAAVVLKEISLDEAIALVRKAADHTEEVMQMNDEQSRKFYLRLFHLLEINNMTIPELAKALDIPKDDKLDLQQGTIPSLDTIRKIAKRFDVTECYLFGVEDETDQGTD